MLQFGTNCNTRVLGCIHHTHTHTHTHTQRERERERERILSTHTPMSNSHFIIYRGSTYIYCVCIE